jgi:hypothetical protein
MDICLLLYSSGIYFSIAHYCCLCYLCCREMSVFDRESARRSCILAGSEQMYPHLVGQRMMIAVN